jgi:predicted permease
MRVFSFILSIVMLLTTLFFMVVDFPSFWDVDSILYFTLLFILFLICTTGIIFNFPMSSRTHYNRFKVKVN